jgi:hypothetical protein
MYTYTQLVINLLCKEDHYPPRTCAVIIMMFIIVIVMLRMNVLFYASISLFYILGIIIRFVFVERHEGAGKWKSKIN